MESSVQPSAHQQTEALVEHFFRHEFGKVIAHLTRTFGTSNIEIIEDAVQDALYKAMQVWPYKEVPDNPSGWIIRVAKNKVIDVLRHNSNQQKVTVDTVALEADTDNHEVTLDSELKDDQLRLFFACCQPDLTVESQIILTLKLLCGFSRTEISRALLKNEDAIAKAFTRARSKMKESAVALEVPQGPGLQSRLEVVLKVLYLLFNEGYKAAQGEDLIREDLCEEAMRLCELLTDHPHCSLPEVHALMALMCFQSSRFATRLAADGALLTLDQQDRTAWNQELIQLGNVHMARSISGVRITEYHIQARIAYHYSNAISYEKTNWEQILQLYDLMLRSTPSPVARLNRLVVYSKVHGATAALQAFHELKSDKKLSNYHLTHAIEGELLKDSGNTAAAGKAFDQAIALAQNATEKAFLVKKREALTNS